MIIYNIPSVCSSHWKGCCETWTLDPGLDHGLDYGLD